MVNQSEWIDPSVWTLTTASVSISSNLSPDGYANCTRVERTSVANSYVRQVVSISSGGTYTTSIYARKVSGGDTFNIINANGSTSPRTLTTEWQRFYITATNATAGRVYFQLAQDNDVIEIWGAQFEEGSYPTSYIPNHSGGSVTRGADECTGAVNASNFNDSEGVLYAEISALANDGTFRNISVSNGTTAQAIRIYYRSNDNQITFLLGSSSGSSITTSIPSSTELIKVAAKYDTDTIKLFVNGAFINSVSSLTMPTGLQQLDFNIAGVLPFYGNSKQILYFPEALSDADCITLTTL